MTILQQLLTNGFLRRIDVQAARMLVRLGNDPCPELPIAAAFASWATGQGHTCLPLSALSGLLVAAGMDGSRFADQTALGTRLLNTGVVGRPGEIRPLILDAEQQLYLHRFFKYEETIAAALLERTHTQAPLATQAAIPLLDLLFPVAATPSGTVDRQRIAAALTLFKRFLVISGGPGTGKTYTVARILALLAALSPQKLRIGLAAPTGKAALRLQESIRNAKTSIPAAMADLIPDQAQTLHRLLGFQSLSQGFLYNSSNPLHLDLLILDEASMIDVPLMAALLTALPATCRVVLLGDRDQLASVEAGNLFGDICGTGDILWSQQLIEQLQPLMASTLTTTLAAPPNAAPDAMAESLVLLQTSHRFREASGIGALARAINTGSEAALEAVITHSYPDLQIEEYTGPTQTARLREQIERLFTPLFAAASAQAALHELGRCRVLCALREGPSGVDGVNRLAEHIFREKGLIGTGERCYRGMPILILRNDYNLHLFNGDTGILWPDAHGALQAWFPDENNRIRSIALARLPPWQTSFAITVHKSQGSEFMEVLMLLPQEDVQVLSRELLYTGMTRAREHLTVYGGKELLLRTMQRHVVRYSGLNRKLRRHEHHPAGSPEPRPRS